MTNINGISNTNSRKKSKNEFGGGNEASSYIPLTEIEQEFISRLVESGDIVVVLHGWGVVYPKVSFGDKVLHAQIKFLFDKAPPPPGISVPFFDMELKTQSGISLYRQKMPTSYDNTPIIVSNEVELEMVWDISLKYIDPKLIKLLMPSVIGYTSRLEDRDTHDITVTGNMRLSKDLTRKAYDMHENELKMKQYDEKRLRESLKKV
tara:strand:+ start:448 stop:1065 length:618 start_codon:yes stop_codon:yes gene_type:complete